MNRQSAEVPVITLAVTGGLRHHHPKGLLRAIGQETLIDSVGLHVQSGTQNRLDNMTGIDVVVSAERRHDCKVHLRRCGNPATQLFHRLPAVLVIEELPVVFHLTPNHRRFG